MLNNSQPIFFFQANNKLPYFFKKVLKAYSILLRNSNYIKCSSKFDNTILLDIQLILFSAVVNSV